MDWRQIKSCIILHCVLIMLSASMVSGQDDSDLVEGKIQVFVSVLPQAYFVDRVGGDLVEATVLVGPGESPATYDPSPHEIGHLSDADVYFKIGVPFETRLLEKAKKIIPDLNIVDTRAGIKLRAMESHDPHPGHHQHEGDDPHIWLDPQLVKIQAATIAAELTRLMPSQAEKFNQNLKVFNDDLNHLDVDISKIMESNSNRRFYVFHPSYGYFADQYGLTQVAVETSGKGPGAKRLGMLVEQAKADRINAIFVQAQFATGPAEAIAHEIGVEVVQLDPLARDYISNLRQMAQRIAESFEGVNQEKAEGNQE